jgi:hypothetical protein
MCRRAVRNGSSQTRCGKIPRERAAPGILEQFGWLVRHEVGTVLRGGARKEAWRIARGAGDVVLSYADTCGNHGATPALVAVSQASQSLTARDPAPSVAVVAIIETPPQPNPEPSKMSTPQAFPYGTACDMGDASRT